MSANMFSKNVIRNTLPTVIKQLECALETMNIALGVEFDLKGDKLNCSYETAYSVDFSEPIEELIENYRATLISYKMDLIEGFFLNQNEWWESDASDDELVIKGESVKFEKPQIKRYMEEVAHGSSNDIDEILNTMIKKGRLFTEPTAIPRYWIDPCFYIKID